MPGFDQQSKYQDGMLTAVQARIHPWLLLAFLGIGIMNIGCIFSNWIPVAENQINDSSILFMDDFSDPKSGWDTWSDHISSVEYDTGWLRMVVRQPYFDFRTSPGLSFQDSKVQVTAAMAGGPVDNLYGLVCRYQDEGNYYTFLVGSDGYGGIARVMDGDFEVITGGKLQFDARIKQASAPNRLEAQCVGPRLTFLVNDDLIYEVGDPKLIHGKVGLMAGSYQVPGVDIIFDDFRVLKP